MGRTAAEVPAVTRPLFSREAEEAARRLMVLDVDDLATALKVGRPIAAENKLRYEAFFDDSVPVVPAVLAYTGIVFRYLRPGDFSANDFGQAQRHLWITSFLYGLLRPLDGIRPYRLEGDVVLPGDAATETRFDYWRPRLTDVLIDSVRADDGVLVNLASAEMKRLFDWRRVARETTVVTPVFKVAHGGGLRTVVVYAKMCRGAMARHLLLGDGTGTEKMEAFDWEGFHLRSRKDGEWLFANE